MVEEKKRLISLDIARGFDMIWIMGLEDVVVALAGLLGWDWLARQMHHPAWHGLTFIDTVFPTFLFLAGLSFPFSLASSREKGRSTIGIVLRIVRRAFLLALLGMIYNGLLEDGFSDLRYASVLGRIGLGWGLAAIVYMFVGFKGRIAVFVATLAAYFFGMKYLPGVLGLGDPMSLKGNLCGYIDRLLLPGVFVPAPGVFDVEGILGVVPSACTALLGTFVGDIVRCERWSGKRKSLWLLVMGSALVVFGLLVAFAFPINKKLWSPSFVLLMGGYSTCMFLVFYYFADVRGYVKPFFVFRVIGLNAITIYMLQRMVHLHGTNKFLFGAIAGMFGSFEELFLALTYTFLCWVILWLLYKGKIFLKV
ncbi:DUF5009 domain-containing protein [bacterium]|nr:DUF5009 domain-containing protein [bacterium]